MVSIWKQNPVDIFITAFSNVSFSLWHFIASSVLFGCVYLRVNKYLMRLFLGMISHYFLFEVWEKLSFHGSPLKVLWANRCAPNKIIAHRIHKRKHSQRFILSISSETKENLHIFQNIPSNFQQNANKELRGRHVLNLFYSLFQEWTLKNI